MKNGFQLVILKKDETEKLTNEFIKLDSKKDKTEATELIKNEIIPLNEEIVSKLASMYEDVIDYQQKVFKKYNLEQSDEKIGNFSKLEKANEK